MVEPFGDGDPATAITADLVDVLYGVDFDALCVKTQSFQVDGDNVRSCEHVAACPARVDGTPTDLSVGHPAGEALAGGVVAPGAALVEAEEAQTLVAVDEVAEDLGIDPDGGSFVVDFEARALGNVCGETEDAVEAVSSIGHSNTGGLEEEV